MTKINIRHAFNRILYAFERRWESNYFSYEYETYKYLMMFFELINESSIFQNFMNDILMNYLDEFVIVYLNNNIVYNNNKKITFNTYEKFFNVYARQIFKQT
jgi:hypothetical protein